VAVKGTDVLRRDHEQLRGLLAGPLPESRERKRGLLRQIASGLRVHVDLEEEVLFPAVRRVRSRGARECVRQALAEHHELEAALTRLEQEDPEAPGFDDSLEALRVQLSAHIEHEESDLFVQAQAHLADDRLERLGAQIQSRRQKLGV
jgi:hemerythrin-like domain-containing protein